jgi:hypothetical protein
VNTRDLLDILKLTGIQSVPIGLALILLVIFGKRLAEALLASATELRKLELEKSLAAYEAEMSKAAYSHQVVFGRLHEKRAEAIFELAVLFDKFESKSQRAVSFFGYAGDPPREQLVKEAGEAGTQFLDYYNSHRVLFEERTCVLVENIAKKYSRAFIDLSTLWPQGRLERDNMALWEKAEKAITKEIPPLTKEMLSEFRRLLGVSELPGTQMTLAANTSPPPSAPAASGNP